MAGINRTVLILDHSPHALQTPCVDFSANTLEIDLDGEEDIELEPCSMWSSQVHAALHYTRLALDLSPVNQKTQISVHVAPGVTPSGESVVLNTWTPAEQRLAHITSQLHLLQLQDSSEDVDMAYDTSRIGQALQGAIAHILEPGPQSTGAVIQAQSGLATSQSYASSIASRRRANIVMILVDGEEENGEESDAVWFYKGRDLRRLVANIHVDFIRVTSDRSIFRQDTVNCQISRASTASVFTVRSLDENTICSALTKQYLLQNKDIQIMRIRDLPLKSHSATEIDLFIRAEHLKRATAKHQGYVVTGILEQAVPPSTSVANLKYVTQCTQTTYCLPSKCAHLASLSPSTFVSSFLSFAGHGSVHLLREEESEALATTAIIDHNGQLFVHCLKDDEDSIALLAEIAASDDLSAPKRFLGPTESDRVEDFLEVIIRPNTITPGHSFAQEGNTFTEILPTPPPRATDKDPNMEGISTAPVTKLALIHSTTKLDIETRWLCQWDGDRSNTISRSHETQIQLFRAAICKAQVDAAGIATINHVLDTLVLEAKPPILPGEQAPVGGKAFGQQQLQQQRSRESARSLLANLWMIGQRFKSISPSHLEVAKIIATKITPKGLDHQTVKHTLIPPNQRRRMIDSMMNAGQGDFSGGSPNVDGDMGDVWNKNRGNVGRGGGGGGRGGRFNNNQRGGGMSDRGRGRGGMTSGPGGHNANNDGVVSDIMLSMTGKTQPVPYLVTTPQTRDEIEESEQDYLAQLGDDGCLLKAYWGSRGAQTSSLAAVLRSGNSSLLSSKTGYHEGDPMSPAVGAMNSPVVRPATKRLRLQDFAGRTPYDENGGLASSKYD
ncbi:hypothetical protein MVEG_06472 [Podila verticillata NRRL 6337]|nr:hypothetical protein MVEG_06472 [Podila verticillata NRRL 6337]